MDRSESCDKLNNKLQSDQSKLKDKQQELVKLNADLRSMEERRKERKQLNSQINEKTKSIEQLFRRVKANFDTFPGLIDDLDAYAKQALKNKHKFEVPIDEFQKCLNSSLTKLNDQINEKIDAIKLKYQMIIDKLRVKKEHLERLTNASLNEHEQLQSSLNEANQTIERLQEEIKNKHHLEQEHAAEQLRIAEQNKQFELKTESTLKTNQSIVEEFDQITVQFKKADEDKRSIESKIKMQDELIDCTRLMIQELENNISSNVNYQTYKDEYDGLEQQVQQLESEYEDRMRIYQMKANCRELRERKVEQINQMLRCLKSVEAEQLGEKEQDARIESIIGEVQKEIKLLEDELEHKGLTSQPSQQLNAMQSITQVNVTTQQSTQMTTAGDQSKKQLDDPTKTETDKFKLVPAEMMGYLYDTKAILFGSQDEEDNQPGVDKENWPEETNRPEKANRTEEANETEETNEPANSTEPALRSFENRPEDCLFTSSYGLDEFTNPVIPEFFTSPAQLAMNDDQSGSTRIENGQLVNSQPSIQLSAHNQAAACSQNESDSLQVSKTSTLANADTAFAFQSFPSGQSDPKDSQLKTPRPVQSSGQESQTKDTAKRKQHADGSDKTKRRRQN